MLVNNTNIVGGCLKSSSPEGIVLTQTQDTGKNLILKRTVIAKYLFNMAFENVFDLGYVTEKPWDALLAGHNIFLHLRFFRRIFSTFFWTKFFPFFMKIYI